ncbi:MAG: alpha-mannosidase [bacterium]
MDIRKIFLISHTNWDREWYLTFERYRFRMVAVLDKLLDVFEKEPNFLYYTWDGHTIFLDDYLQIRPENEGRLRRYIREGRLLVGPWYVMPDEYLASGESLIRNLTIGIQMARGYGNVMRAGFLVDTFGHISQMPQILKGFGIDNAILWRGVGSELDETEFNWESPDGTIILATHLADHNGYSDLPTIPESAEEFVQRVKELKEKLAPRCSAGCILIMNGGDYSQPNSHLPKILDRIGGRVGESQIVQGTVPQYIEEVREANPPLKAFRGELRSSEKTVLLHDVRSTRISVKQRNNEVQTLLERWAEPMATWAWALGRAYPQGFLLQAWKYLIQCHLHDPICGSCIDEVQDEMASRFNWAESIGNEVIEESLEFISKNIDASSDGMNCVTSLIVFNPTSGPRTDCVDAEIWLPGEKMDFAIRDSRGKAVPCQRAERGFKEVFSMRFKVSDAPDLWERLRGVLWEIHGGIAQNLRVASMSIERDADVIEIVLYPAREGIFKAMGFDEIKERVQTFLDESDPEEFHLRVKVAGKLPLLFLAEGVPAHGYKSYFVEYRDAVEDLPPSGELAANPTHIENEYYKVEVEADSPTLRITDKLTGEVYEGCNCFVDGGDKGDTHSFCPPEEDKIVGSSDRPFRTSLVEDGPVRVTLRIEFDLPLPRFLSYDRRSRSEETVSCPVATSVSLYPKVKRIDFRTEIDNRAKDHRLRVHFPTKIATDHCFAEGNFDVIKREIDVPEATGWVERPSGAHPQRAFVDVSDGRTGFAVINRGLPEFQVIRERGGSTVALTLLRCVGRLGRSDLSVRHGGGGPFVEIPKAQCLGRNIFEYSLVPHSGTWESSEIYRDAHWFNAPLRAHQTGLHSGKLPPESSFIEVEPPSLVVSAIKKGEEGNFLILRLYNIGTRDVEGRIKIFKHCRDAKLVDLMEEEIDGQSLPIGDESKVNLKFKGGEIKTVRFAMG